MTVTGISNYISFRGINPAIKVRKNSRCKNTNHYLRNKTVKMQKKNSLQQSEKIALAMDKDGLQKQYFHV